LIRVKEAMENAALGRQSAAVGRAFHPYQLQPLFPIDQRFVQDCPTLNQEHALDNLWEVG